MSKSGRTVSRKYSEYIVKSVLLTKMLFAEDCPVAVLRATVLSKIATELPAAYVVG